MGRWNCTLFSDWSRLPNLTVLALVFVLSRLPLVNLGFGLDADAWRIANTAFDLRHHTWYHASRFPGYPLPEFVNALIIEQGWLATNILTMILAFVSVLVFIRILRALNHQHHAMVIITYAFLPLLWINSTNTMDYTWALCFIMCAWLFAIKQHWIMSGLMMGLAVGSRLPTLVIVLPFLYLCYSANRKVMDILRFLITAMITSIVLYVPLFWTYGLEFLHRYQAETGLVRLGYLAIKHFGLLTLVALIVLLFTSFRQMRRVFIEKDRHTMFVLFASLTGLTAFLAMPYHIEYLIPIIPFALAFIFRVGKKWLLLPFTVLAMSHACVSIMNIQHIGHGRVRTSLCASGSVIRNITERKQQIAFVQDIMQASINDRSVVIIGTWLPVLAYSDGNVSSVSNTKRMYDANRSGEGVQDFQRNVLYRYLLTRRELEDLLEQNYTVYYIEGMREFTITVHGYDLADYRTIYLDV